MIRDARLADRIGRRQPVVVGMVLSGLGVVGIVAVESFPGWLAMAVLSGTWMALPYPTLMTAPGDACHPSWRAAGMGPPNQLVFDHQSLMR